MTDSIRNNLKKKFNDIASQGLRWIGLAINYNGGQLGKMTADNKKEMLSNFAKYGDYETGATFIGVVAIKDPLREQVPGAIQSCK